MASPPLHDPEREAPATIVAMRRGTCHRGRHPFPAGSTIVPEGPRIYSCVDCVANDVQPPVPVSDDQLLEHAREGFRSIVRRARAGAQDPETALAEIEELAINANALLGEQRRAA